MRIILNMQKNIKIIINTLSGIGLLGLGILTGFIISKKRYSPKLTAGEIYIDYTEDSNHPIMYLNNLDPKTFSNDTKFIILGLNHIRK